MTLELATAFGRALTGRLGKIEKTTGRTLINDSSRFFFAQLSTDKQIEWHDRCDEPVWMPVALLVCEGFGVIAHHCHRVNWISPLGPVWRMLVLMAFVCLMLSQKNLRTCGCVGTRNALVNIPLSCTRAASLEVLIRGEAKTHILRLDLGVHIRIWPPQVRGRQDGYRVWIFHPAWDVEHLLLKPLDICRIHLPPTGWQRHGGQDTPVGPVADRVLMYAQSLCSFTERDTRLTHCPT